MKSFRLGLTTVLVIIIIVNFWGGYLAVYNTESLRQPPNELISLNFFLIILGFIQTMKVIEHFKE